MGATPRLLGRHLTQDGEGALESSCYLRVISVDDTEILEDDRPVNIVEAGRDEGVEGFPRPLIMTIREDRALLPLWHRDEHVLGVRGAQPRHERVQRHGISCAGAGEWGWRISSGACLRLQKLRCMQQRNCCEPVLAVSEPENGTNSKLKSCLACMHAARQKRDDALSWPHRASHCGGALRPPFTIHRSTCSQLQLLQQRRPNRDGEGNPHKIHASRASERCAPGVARRHHQHARRGRGRQ